MEKQELNKAKVMIEKIKVLAQEAKFSSDKLDKMCESLETEEDLVKLNEEDAVYQSLCDKITALSIELLEMSDKVLGKRVKEDKYYRVFRAKVIDKWVYNS